MLEYGVRFLLDWTPAVASHCSHRCPVELSQVGPSCTCDHCIGLWLPPRLPPFPRWHPLLILSFRCCLVRRPARRASLLIAVLMPVSSSSRRPSRTLTSVLSPWLNKLFTNYRQPCPGGWMLFYASRATWPWPAEKWKTLVQAQRAWFDTVEPPVHILLLKINQACWHTRITNLPRTLKFTCPQSFHSFFYLHRVKKVDI